MMDADDIGSDVVFALFAATAAIYVYLLFGNGFSGLSVLQLTYPYHAIVTIPILIMNAMLSGTFILVLVICTRKWTKIAAIIVLISEAAGIVLLYLSGLNTLTQIAAFLVGIGIFVGTVIGAMVAFFGD